MIAMVAKAMSWESGPQGSGWWEDVARVEIPWWFTTMCKAWWI